MTQHRALSRACSPPCVCGSLRRHRVSSPGCASGHKRALGKRPARLPPIAWQPSTPRLAAASTSGRVHIYEVLHGSGGAQLQEQKVLAHKDQRQVCLRGSIIVVGVLRDPPANLV